MLRDTAPLYSPIAIRRWMAAHEDSTMDDPWNDSDDFIEDRTTRGHYHAREEFSRWAGCLPRPTFVYGRNAALDGPTPPFKKFGRVENHPGDNPGALQAHIPGAPPIPMPGMAVHPDRPGRYTPDTGSASGYASRSDDSRAPDMGREDDLRYRALSSRDRYSNEPYWDDGRFDTRPRFDNRPHHAQRSNNNERRRDHNFAFADNRVHTRELVRPRPNTPPRTPPSMAVRDIGDPPRIIPSQDLHLAPRGSDGHPQSAWALRQADPESILDEDSCPGPDVDFCAEEEARIVRTHAKPINLLNNLAPLWNEGNPRLLGRFHHCQIQTLHQAYNLIAFMQNGQQEAYELFMQTTQNLAAFPLRFRTEGEAHLMRHQQQIDRTWWINTTGGPRPPRHVRHPNPRPGPSTPYPRRIYAPGPSQPGRSIPAEMQAEREAPCLYGPLPATAPPTYTFGSAGPLQPAAPTTTIASTRCSVTPTVSADSGVGYLATSPPNPTDTPPVLNHAGLPALNVGTNSRWTIGELENRFSRMHPDGWNRGILNFSARRGTTLGDTPRRINVLALNTFMALCPMHRRALAHQHHLFLEAGVRLFSIDGLYEYILRTGGYPVDSLPLDHYPFLTDNITIFLVAAWFAQHGIAPGTPDVLALEEFARLRRNMSAGISNLDNMEWNDEPYSARIALSMTGIPTWAELRHAPQRPAETGLAASLHAPGMDDVVLTTPNPPPMPPTDSEADGEANDDTNDLLKDQATASSG
ncbi:hypothetical protein B0H11DRAFT_2237139 [Mycena galericulata]|nr:hypothetical protein B0H11DRAFT_2237139 [Mycena galericulata]